MSCYISRTFEDSRSEQITVRIISNGLTEPPDDDWSKASPEEQIEAVWTLTELVWLGTNLQQVNQGNTPGAMAEQTEEKVLRLLLAI